MMDSSRGVLPHRRWAQYDPITRCSSNGKTHCHTTSQKGNMMYYKGQGYTKIPATRSTVYSKVLDIAKKHGWTSGGGLWPTVIDDVAKETLAAYGYKSSDAWNIYVLTFNTVKSEINSGRPVLMNIARGYYGNHTVTANGWGTYTAKYKSGVVTVSASYNMIAIFDGWQSTRRYIDYSAFAYDLVSSGFGSFTYVRPKK